MGRLTFNDIVNESEQYRAELESPLPTEINELCDRLALLAGLQARTGYILAEAKKYMREKKASQIAEMLVKIAKEGCLSAKAQNAIVDSFAIEECYLVDLIERQNAACTHQADACRTIISKLKEEMRYASYTAQ
ncbi:MAG: hypothetical protein PUF10_02665 [Bacteroidales bacterium]|nr:hypothetical protein [Bacteroidales bacterium]